MRYFILTDANGKAKQTLASMRVPGDGGADGRTMPSNCVEVTQDEYEQVSATLAHGWTVDKGVLVEPLPRLPVLNNGEFVLLFTRDQWKAIRASRTAQADEDLEYFLDLFDRFPTIDLSNQRVLAMVQGGLSLLVSKKLIAAEEATRIASGIPPS